MSISEYKVEIQGWDSDRLGLRVGRIQFLDGSTGLPTSDYSALLVEVAKMGLVYVTARIPLNQTARAQALKLIGFQTIDSIVEFSKASLAKKLSLSEPYRLRLAGPGDAEQVAALAIASFTLSRFHNDPLLTKAQADRVHSEWAKNSCLGVAAEAVWLIEANGALAGFVTCKTKDGVGIIDLIAVAADHAGHGLGRALCGQAENWFAEQGCSKVLVQTQDNNHAAHKLYRACGFQRVGASTTLRWAAKGVR